MRNRGVFRFLQACAWNSEAILRVDIYGINRRPGWRHPKQDEISCITIFLSTFNFENNS